MDKPRSRRLPVFREERFRVPSPLERRSGLWVDRIGSAVNRDRPRGLRILGQYAAVSIVTGRGTFISKSLGTRQCVAGDVMLLFPEEPAMYYPDAEWRTLWVVWNGAEARRLESLGLLSARHGLARDSFGAVAQAHATLQRLMGQEGLAPVLKRKIVILEMIHELYRQRESESGSRDARMEEAVQRIRDHPGEPMRVTDLARSCGISPQQFRRLFRAHTGRGPCEFITARRMALAKECLARGMTIKETATCCGYDDLFYFMRVFRRVAGVPPGRFAALAR